MDEANDWANWFLEFIDREVSEPHTLAVALVRLDFMKIPGGITKLQFNILKRQLNSSVKLKGLMKLTGCFFNFITILGYLTKILGSLMRRKVSTNYLLILATDFMEMKIKSSRRIY